MNKILFNGILRDMTPEDERYFPEVEIIKPEIDPNEVWKTEIEAALIELAAMIEGGI